MKVKVYIRQRERTLRVGRDADVSPQFIHAVLSVCPFWLDVWIWPGYRKEPEKAPEVRIRINTADTPAIVDKAFDQYMDEILQSADATEARARQVAAVISAIQTWCENATIEYGGMRASRETVQLYLDRPEISD